MKIERGSCDTYIYTYIYTRVQAEESEQQNGRATGGEPPARETLRDR